MKLLILATGKTENIPDGYGSRLIEQGRAVLAPAAKAKPAPAEEDKEEKPKKKG